MASNSYRKIDPLRMRSEDADEVLRGAAALLGQSQPTEQNTG